MKDSSVEVRRFVLMLTLYLSASQWVNNTTQMRDTHAGGYTRESLLHERIWSHLVVKCFLFSRQRCLDSSLPQVLIVRIVAPE